MELSRLLTQNLVDFRLSPQSEVEESQITESSEEEQSIEENKIASEQGGVMDKLGGTTSGVGVGNLTDKNRKKDKGGIMDNLKSNTSGAGVGGELTRRGLPERLGAGSLSTRHAAGAGCLRGPAQGGRRRQGRVSRPV